MVKTVGGLFLHVGWLSGTLAYNLVCAGGFLLVRPETLEMIAHVEAEHDSQYSFTWHREANCQYVHNGSASVWHRTTFAMQERPG